MFGGGNSDGFFIRNKSVFVMGLIALLIAAVADLIAGMFLTTMEEYILLIPGMMIMIYSAIGMRGNIFGAMGSRLGTSMHMGTFKMSFKKGTVLRSNIEASMVLTLSLSAIMGIIGWIIVELFFTSTIEPLSFIFISLVGGILAGIIVIIFNIIIAREGYKRDWDVDNITAPLIAAAGDIATVPMIFVATWMVLNIDRIYIDIVCVILLVLTVAATAKVLMRKARRRRRIDEAKRIVKQSIPVLTACIFFEIAAGIIVENGTNAVMKYSVLLVLLPAFLNEGNALSGMLTSRLSSMLHIGTMESRKYPNGPAYENFLIIYILATVTFLFIGTAAYILQPGSLDYVTVIAIVLISGLLATTVINFLSYYVAVSAVKFDLDPDDHCIPITSSIMDMVGTAIIVTVISLMI
jgi:mgtE-like transporter